MQDAPSKTDRPWPEVMDELRGKTSQDDVAFKAREHGAPSTFTGSWISQLRQGHRPLRQDMLEGIAGALGVPPETFAEYRLAKARHALDEREVGLDEAAEALSRFEGALRDGDGEMPSLDEAVAEAEAGLGDDESEDEPQRR